LTVFEPYSSLADVTLYNFLAMPRSAEGRLLHREVGTRSVKRWLLGHAEAIRRAQRRQMYGAEATYSAKERVDNSSDFTTT